MSSQGITNGIEPLRSAPPVSTPVQVGDRASAPANLPQDRLVKQSGLNYTPTQLPDVNQARSWTPGSTGMTGKEANKPITAAYCHLDREMMQYMGTPLLANWTTFGKYASASAGEQIIQTEAMARVLNGHIGSVFQLMYDFFQHPILGFDQIRALMTGGLSLSAFRKNVMAMRNALVYGNTGIIQNIGPAYDVFLQAEANGKDGVAALRAKGYGRAPVDPQGFMLKAFEAYQKAKSLGDQANALQAGPDASKQKARIAALQNERKQWVYQGNILLAMQEQWFSAQTPQTFGNPQVAKLIARLSGSIELEDPNGAHTLLPKGGDWANFYTRMGLVPAPASTPADQQLGVFEFRDPSGQTRRYVLNKAPGTIGAYFASGHDRELLLGHPEPQLQAGRWNPLPKLAHLASSAWHTLTSWL
ncbi:MAG TPA: hypothetical protein V6D47_05375 [Oscillatoriaceae cyanobacterium]